jgi:lipid-A-disaccharide synthase
MKPKSFFLIAGEASGDMLAAELVQALRSELDDEQAEPTRDFQPLQTSLAPRFFGAGGPQMAAAGVDLAFDMTAHSVIGLSDALKNYFKFRRLFHQLFQIARERQPNAIICVDFAGFNRRFASAIRKYIQSRSDWFHDWDPKIIQYVSPQVWASREGRVYQIARDYDLLLSIFPFEKEWYARRVPNFHVEFVGHPLVDRYAGFKRRATGQPAAAGTLSAQAPNKSGNVPMVLLLPGSRPGELMRHLPVMIGALKIMRASFPDLRARAVLPHDGLLAQAKSMGLPPDLELQIGRLPEALSEADVAIASTGTVTVECAFFGVPTIALYKTTWSTYHIGKRIIKVKYLAMPNLLANEPLFPEFIQNAATAENIARAALDLLSGEQRRARIQTRLGEIVSSLGSPGASRRAAQAILHLIDSRKALTAAHRTAQAT